MDACKIDVNSCGRTESSRKLMKCPVDARKVDGWSTGHRESWWKVLQQHRKVTEGHVAKRKVDGCWRKVPLLHKQLMEGPRSIRKVDRRSRRDTESGRRHNGSGQKCRYNTIIWRRILSTHLKLTQGPVHSQKVDGISRKVPWMHM